MRVQMPYVETTKAKGKVYRYYRRDGRRHGRLNGEPGSTQFLADYYRIHAGFEGDENTAIPGSFHDAVTQYLQSPEYLGLAENSRAIYRRYLDEAREVLGKFDIEKIKKTHIRAYRDTLQATPGRATFTVKVISAFYDWAGEALDIENNPAKGVKGIKGGEHQAWPEAAIERFLEVAPADIAAVFLMGLYTGQRRGDILSLRWDALEGGGLNFRQQKTGAAVWVPMHPELAALVSNLPKRGTVMLTTETGRAWSVNNFRAAFNRARKEAGCGDLVFHGLRKTAASRLAECGCSTEEIKSITGHASDQMAAYYARSADQKRKARNAIAKLERGTKQQ